MTPTSCDDFGPFEPSDSLAARVKPELYPGERLLWAVEIESRPADSWPLGHRLAWATAFLIPGFALFSFRWSPRRPGLDLATHIGLILVTLGVLILIFAAQAWLDLRRSARPEFRPTYALTDRRAILWTRTRIYNAPPGAIEVRSVFRGDVKSVHRIEYPDGTGDVVFNLEDDEEGYSLNSIEGIPNVRRVEDLARRTLLGLPEIGT